MSAIELDDRRKVTWDTLGTAHLDDYAADILFIWGRRDSQRPLLEIWAHVVEHASRLAEGLRRARYDEVQVELAGVFFWVISFIVQAKAQGRGDEFVVIEPSIPDLIWNKFPNMCPVCRKDLCVCLVNLKEAELRHEDPELSEDPIKKREQVREVASERRDQSPDSLDGFERMFETIYNRNIFASHINTIGFHLLEEIGEVTKAILEVNYYAGKVNLQEYPSRLHELEDELADVFSWIFSLSCKLRLDFETFDRYMIKRIKSDWNEVATKIRLSSAVGIKYCASDPPKKLYCKLHCTAQPECECPVISLREDADAADFVRKLMSQEH